MVIAGRGELGGKNGGVFLFIIVQSRLCIFEILFWDPRVFLSGVFFPSDQEGPLGWSASVV